MMVTGLLVVVVILLVAGLAVLGARLARVQREQRRLLRGGPGLSAPESGAPPEALAQAVEHLVRMNHEMLDAQHRLSTQQLAGERDIVDRQVGAMRTELARLTDLLVSVEAERREQAGAMTAQLAEAGRNTRALAESTQSLREALSSTTARGQWGERMADDVLRLAGFVDGVNYRRHVSIIGAGGQAGVPDYTFLLPDGLNLHMDVKFPLNNYLRYLDATSDVERERMRREFLKDVRLRLKEVTTREYIGGDDTVDCVLLFIPNEQVYAFIQEHDRTLLDDALRDKVVFCSPLTLYAVLAVIRQAVDNFRLSRTSHEILTRLQAFRKQWDRFVEQMDKAGRAVRAAGNAFDELEGTRRRQLDRELDRIDDLHRRSAMEEGAADSAVGQAVGQVVGEVMPKLALEA
jgi:DNA recombination protein RmuC